MAARLVNPSVRSTSKLLGPLLATCALAACAPPTNETVDSVTNPVSRDELNAVADMRVLFAHQSVGYNILDGVKSLASAESVPFDIVESNAPSASNRGIVHFAVGTNGDPDGKLADYRQVLSAAADEVDVALIKLCYIDFTAETDPRELADHYVATLEQLQSAHPHTLFAAVTAPLTTVQTGPKAWIKRLLGRSPAGFLENAKREEFNDMLRKEIEPSRLFDIARVETHGSGKQSPRALAPELTSDGGHLNEAGQLIAGAAFVKFLASSRAASPGTE
jgi:hypothetical protein